MLGTVVFLHILEVNLFIILKHFIFLLILSSGRSYKVRDSDLGLLPYLLFFLFQSLSICTCDLLLCGNFIQSTDIY